MGGLRRRVEAEGDDSRATRGLARSDGLGPVVPKAEQRNNQPNRDPSGGSATRGSTLATEWTRLGERPPAEGRPARSGPPGEPTECFTVT